MFGQSSRPSIAYPMGVGTTSAMVARKSKERLATAAVELNFCSGCLMPPKRKQQPVLFFWGGGDGGGGLGVYMCVHGVYMLIKAWVE